MAAIRLRLARSTFDGLTPDLRHALRGLLRRPSFTFTAVLTLAFGIGATVAIFSVVYSVLIRSLPYPNPDELVRVRHSAQALGNEIFTASTMYLTYREENRSFQDFGLWQEGTGTLTGTGNPEQLRVLRVTDGTLQALGIRPARGRWFMAEEHESDATEVEPVILTHGFWQRRFGGDESALGLQFELDANPVNVIGIMPPEFRFLDIAPQPDVIRAVRLDPARQVIGAFSFQALGRLKPGISLAEAGADIERMLPIWLATWPITSGSRLTREAIADWRIAPVLRPLKEDLTDSIAATLWVLMGAIGIVLLVACGNITNLMLLRAAARREELAMRAALGAVPARIVRSLLIEGLAIGAAAGALGLTFAALCLRALTVLGPADLPRIGEVSIYPPVLAFAVGATLVSVLTFVAVTACKFARPSKLSVLDDARASSSSSEQSKARSTLVVVQVALALVLVVSAALMIRSLEMLLDVDPGFSQPASVQTARASFARTLIPDAEQLTVVQQEILAGVASLPGVDSAAMASAVPMDGRFNSGPITVDASASRIDESAYSHRFKWVSPGYFAAMGTRIVAGRDVSWRDIDSGGRVAVISESLARQIANDPAGALGQRIKVPIEQDAWREVIGVAQDVYEDGLYTDPPSTVYWPVHMQDFFDRETFGQRDIAYVIRSERAGTVSLMDEVREVVWSVNANVPVFSERSLRELYSDSLARTSFVMALLTIAGAMALALGVIGIYGTMAYVVSQRKREIGIRCALGAGRRELRNMILRQGLRLAAVGAAVGLLVAVLISRSLSSVLYGVGPQDPAAFAIALGVTLLAATLATYLPASRAARIDPIQTLKAD